MRAGAKDRRIRLQGPLVTKDSFGGTVRTWADVVKVWAGVRNLSGGESAVTKHGGESGQARTEFLIWYRAGVTAALRIVYDGQVYNIRHVNDVRGQRREMLLTCDLQEGPAP
jgi:SPP1 family predicted phage head-tail adaptor